MEEFIIRGIWISNKSLQGVGVERIVNQCKEAGVKAIFPYTCSGKSGSKYYNVILPQLIEVSHSAQIEVHPWMEEMWPDCYDKGESLLQRFEDGSHVETVGVCPANPLVQEHNVCEARRLVSQYRVDGITLEDSIMMYSREYQGKLQRSCFCDFCRKNAPIGKPEWDE